MYEIFEDRIPGTMPDVKDKEPSITPYTLKDGDKHSAVLICPGGGYGNRAYHEGEPLAGWFNSMGISAFVLNYRVSPYGYPYPQMDAARAMQYLRFHSEKFNIIKNQIGILGFSAGGHLAAFTGVNNNLKEIVLNDNIGKLSYRPDFMILAYPVISMGKFTHSGSKRNLLKEQNNEEITKLCSIEKNVNQNTPPAFIWHTADDKSVPVENSLLLAMEMAKNNIDYELHIFESGRHGLGIKYDVPNVRRWMNLCENWLINKGYTG